MPDRRKIKILSVLMAEDLRVEASGLHTVVGLIPGRVVVRNLPHTFLKLFYRIEFESETSFSGTCEFSIRTPSRASILQGTSKANIRHAVRNIFAVGGGPVQFSEPGRYAITFNIDQADPDHKRDVGYFDIVHATQALTGGGTPVA